MESILQCNTHTSPKDYEVTSTYICHKPAQTNKRNDNLLKL